MDRVPPRGVGAVPEQRWLRCQAASAGRLTMASSLIGAMVSSVMYRALHGPFVILFEQDGADQADDGGLVGKDADDIGCAA